MHAANPRLGTGCSYNPLGSCVVGLAPRGAAGHGVRGSAVNRAEWQSRQKSREITAGRVIAIELAEWREIQCTLLHPVEEKTDCRELDL